ncbi:MAG TPA: hypothetical protein DDW52_02095 [Planctomycetaceae bacterium]|nr:hypothetical protein [Planctomycetaceae bacterium]
MADREILIAMVRGAEERLLDQMEKAISQIMRHAQQQELPQVPAEMADKALIATLPLEYKSQPTIWGMFCSKYRPQRLTGKSPETTRMYGLSVAMFGRWLGRPALLSDLTDERVSQFIAWRAENRTLATAGKDAQQLLALWRFAALSRLGPDAPTIRPPDAPVPVPDAWTEDDVAKLVKHIHTLSTTMRNGVPFKLFWGAIVSIALDTGERVGAIQKLTWDRIDSAGWLVVPAESRKGGKHGKRFKLSDNTRELLSKLRKHCDGETVFEWPYHHTYFWKRYGWLLEAAGLPNERRTKFHKIRRTVATHFEAAGGDATELLGHSARAVTRRYIDERQVSRPQPADIGPQWGKGKGREQDDAA